MTVFLVTSQKGDDIESTIQRAYSESERFKISLDKWLVSKKNIVTAFEVWDLLTTKSAPSTVARVIVTEFSNYYGYADASIWQWVNAKRVIS